MNNLPDKYLFQALDAYPYNLEETTEALNYALSYDEENVTALCLMGRLHAEQLRQFEEAIEYYRQALAIDVNAVNVYPYFINALLANEDLKEAEKLINFALQLKGVDKSWIWIKKSILLEMKMEYKAAVKAAKEAKKLALCEDYITYIDTQIKRLKDKMPKKKKRIK